MIHDLSKRLKAARCLARYTLSKYVGMVGFQQILISCPCSVPIHRPSIPRGSQYLMIVIIEYNSNNFKMDHGCCILLCVIDLPNSFHQPIFLFLD